MPDLRAAGHLPRGVAGARVEIEVPDHQVLLSDFDRWHAVLNRHYLAVSAADDHRFEAALRRAGVPARWPYPSPWHEEIVASWKRIFDFSSSARGPAEWGPVDEPSVQAVFWELRAEQVREVVRFRAR